ncbi:hypothetical protein A2572_03500 [Candidatus Collierbacteria bacterium RIFOXYD1_FULL_40_9]|uniref:Rod shape-determining protein MreD n=1 Tax=Candidatus Collierbacteria bacterium RIFOXYD1_FULL_40_9 TaxID=1817731 RepID=A0A1F5FTR9_9BACT|nr:MAG: hypothetical protein A2572_03500 [Candidatus Collierbacteria bacterium RIFOXYD1_FULL_40_9]
MQSKNNIKYLLLFFLGLLLGEAVFGIGLFWSALLVLNIGGYVYWLGLFCGLFLSIYYGQTLGLMSLYIILFLVATYPLFNSGRLKPFLVILVSLVANLLFDYLFGLGFGLGEQLAVFVFSSVLARGVDRDHTIRVNL